MKIQLKISDNEKIITVEESTNLGELINFLQAHFPNDKWKEFKLEVKTIIHWAEPIVIEKQVYPYVPTNPYPNYPWDRPWWEYPYDVYCGKSNTGNCSTRLGDYPNLNSGTYCVEVK